MEKLDFRVKVYQAQVGKHMWPDAGLRPPGKPCSDVRDLSTLSGQSHVLVWRPSPDRGSYSRQRAAVGVETLTRLPLGSESVERWIQKAAENKSSSFNGGQAALVKGVGLFLQQRGFLCLPTI
jgi:hypothetical protein